MDNAWERFLQMLPEAEREHAKEVAARNLLSVSMDHLRGDLARLGYGEHEVVEIVERWVGEKRRQHE